MFVSAGAVLSLFFFFVLFLFVWFLFLLFFGGGFVCFFVFCFLKEEWLFVFWSVVFCFFFNLFMKPPGFVMSEGLIIPESGVEILHDGITKSIVISDNNDPSERRDLLRGRHYSVSVLLNHQDHEG